MFDEAAPKDTRGTFAEISLHPKKNAAKSLEAGRPIFDEVPYIKILLAGNKTEVVHRPVTEQDKIDYPREWAFFLNKDKAHGLSGTPLANLPGITAGFVEEARHLNVRTIEQLAEMPETNVSNLGMGWPKLRQRARDYIAAAAGMAPLEQAHALNAELTARLEAQQKQMDALQRQMEELTRPAEQPKQEQSKQPQRR